MMVMAQLSAAAPLYCDVYVFRRKPNAVITTIDQNFLQAGATSIGYDGDVYAYSGLLAVNDDLYEGLYKRRIKIWNPNSTANHYLCHWSKQRRSRDCDYDICSRSRIH